MLDFIYIVPQFRLMHVGDVQPWAATQRFQGLDPEDGVEGR